MDKGVSYMQCSVAVVWRLYFNCISLLGSCAELWTQFPNLGYIAQDGRYSNEEAKKLFIKAEQIRWGGGSEYSLDLKNKLALAVFSSPLAFIFQISASHQIILV